MRKINFTKLIVDLRGKPVEDGAGKKKTVGDALIDLLSENFSGLKEKREAFWVTELGIIISNAKGEVELSEEKWEFLKRIVEINKIKGQMGVEVDAWRPYIWSVLMSLFQEEEPKKK